MSTAALARDTRQTGEIIPIRREFQMLDVYSDSGVTTIEQPRLDALATISAGYKDQSGKPVVSRDGTIYVSGDNDQAQGLRAALQAANGKSLTIAFPHDDINQFVRQTFAAYTATELKAYGDAKSVTVIDGQQRYVYEAGTPDYLTVVKKCQVVVFVYFYLAEWQPTGPVIVFPDGFAPYRMRFTSRNSLQSMVGYLRHISENHTHGRLAGMPFRLSIAYRDVTGKDGKRRKVPVWQTVFAPPNSRMLTSQRYREIVAGGLEQGENLIVALPEPEAELRALTAGPDVNLDDVSPDDFENPFIACDAEHWRRTFFAVVKGTRLELDQPRHEFIAAHTQGEFVSLADYLESLDEEGANSFVETVRADVEWRWKKLARYDELSSKCIAAGLKRPSGRDWPHFSDTVDIGNLDKGIAAAEAILRDNQRRAREADPRPPVTPKQAPAVIAQAAATKAAASVEAAAADTEGMASFDADEPAGEDITDMAGESGWAEGVAESAIPESVEPLILALGDKQLPTDGIMQNQAFLDNVVRPICTKAGYEVQGLGDIRAADISKLIAKIVSGKVTAQMMGAESEAS